MGQARERDGKSAVVYWREIISGNDEAACIVVLVAPSLPRRLRSVKEHPGSLRTGYDRSERFSSRRSLVAPDILYPRSRDAGQRIGIDRKDGVVRASGGIHRVEAKEGVVHQYIYG